MTPSPQFLQMIRENFFIDPIPSRFFWEETSDLLRGDIATELWQRLGTRPWTAIKMVDWAMIGTPPCVARQYLSPDTFKYYLPSLFIRVFEHPEYLEYSIDGILPYNRDRVVRGRWWNKFLSLFTRRDYICVTSFLNELRKAFPEITENSLMSEIEEVEKFWQQQMLQ